MYVYSLTDLTGRRRNADRRHIIATFEVPYRAGIIGALCILASLPVALMFTLIFGVYAFIIIPIGLGLGLFLFNTRTRKGLQLHRFQSILNRYKSETGQFMQNGIPMADAVFINHQPQVIDGPSTSPNEDIFGELSHAPATPVIGVSANRVGGEVVENVWF